MDNGFSVTPIRVTQHVVVPRPHRFRTSPNTFFHVSVTGRDDPA
jgi:hypothetical protein